MRAETAWFDNGRPISDIHAWARDRGEQMVRVRRTWREALPLAGRIEDRSEVVEMPASFFNGLRFGGLHDESYEEIGRFEP